MKTSCFLCKNKGDNMSHGRTFVCAMRGVIDSGPQNCPQFELDKDKLRKNMVSRVGTIQRSMQGYMKEIREVIELLEMDQNFQNCLAATQAIIEDELSAVEDALKGE